MEETKTQNSSTQSNLGQAKNQGMSPNVLIAPLNDEIKQILNDVILEYKKSGCITTNQLFDKLEKQDTSAVELEEIYKVFDLIRGLIKLLKI